MIKTVNLGRVVGKSAYEQAKEGGYAGTEAEFNTLMANPMTAEKVDERVNTCLTENLTETKSDNLFDFSKATIGSYLTVDGVVTTNQWSTDCIITDYIELSDTSEYIYTGINTVLTAPKGAFYDVNKTLISTFAQSIGSEDYLLDVPDGARFAKFSFKQEDKESFVVKENKTGNALLVIKTEISKAETARIVTVCAYDTPKRYKKNCDFVCTGEHDELVLNQAMQLVSSLGGGTIELANGTYKIDGFIESTDNTDAYVFKTDAQNHSVTIKGMMHTIPMRSSSSEFGDCAKIVVSDECYNSLDDTKKYSIIRGGSKDGEVVYPSEAIRVENIFFKLPGNQKAITCINGLFASCLSVYNCVFFALQEDVYSEVFNPLIPAKNCDAIKGTHGSNFGSGNIWKNNVAYGFRVGFCCSGEHLIVQECTSIKCWFGYTFGLYDATENTFGWFAHPMTIINCADEMSMNMPYFATNNTKQAISIIDFNIEFSPKYFKLGGKYATEANPGSWYGDISYAISDSTPTNSGNTSYRAFWRTNGSGSNMRSKNLALPLKDTESNIKCRAANVGEHFTDNSNTKKVYVCTDNTYVPTEYTITVNSTAISQAGIITLKIGTSTYEFASADNWLTTTTANELAKAIYDVMANKEIEVYLNDNVITINRGIIGDCTAEITGADDIGLDITLEKTVTGTYMSFSSLTMS